MDNELRYLLEQGPTTAQELVRLTGKSKSTIYKLLAADEVIKSDEKPTKYSLKPVEAAAEPTGSTSEAEPSLSPTEAPAVAPVASTGRGRPIANGGKRLYPSTVMEQPDQYSNPRRPNSHGYRSLQIIIDNPGITTEDFLAKGGRSNDLRWDLTKGNARAE